MLFLVNLTSLPLSDPHEGSLALLAQEIYQGAESTNWIFPTLWGEPSLLKSPFIYHLIAVSYHIGGVGELTTRFPGALLGGISVLLLYQIGREIFVARLPALFSALVYLTCLPVVHYSRLATVNGPILCFELLTIWAVLRSRRNLQWSLVTGIGFSLMSLTKGLFSMQILLIALLFLWWDTPRLLTSAYFWLGLTIGATPSIIWYTIQLLHYQQRSDNSISAILWQNQVLAGTLPELVFSSSMLPLALFLSPWMLVMFTGAQSIQQNFHWSWGRLLAVWLGGYLILGFLIFPQDHWLMLPLFPPLALTAGNQLNRVCDLPSHVEYPRFWIFGLAAASVLSALAGLNWIIYDYVDFYLPFICGSLSLTLGTTAIVMAQQDKQFVLLLFWGLFVSIFLLVVSPHWIWKLKAVESIKPIAELVQRHTEPNTVIYSSMSQRRPSLGFYSDRQIINQSLTQLREHWLHDTSTHLLVDATTSKKLNLPQQAIVAEERFNSTGWMLAIKSTNTN